MAWVWFVLGVTAGVLGVYAFVVLPLAADVTRLIDIVERMKLDRRREQT